MASDSTRAAPRISRDAKLCALAVAIMIAFVVGHIVALDVPALRRLELGALDMQMRVRGARAAGPETVIIMIDDATIATLGRWPVPRASLADVVTMLHGAGARTIGIDILFADPDTAQGAGAHNATTGGDTLLAKAIREAGNVVLPYAFRFGGTSDQAKPAVEPIAYAHLTHGNDFRPLALKPTGFVMPTRELAETAVLGHILVAYDVDGAARYDYPVLEFDLDYYPSMAIRVAQQYLRVPWHEARVELGQRVVLGTVSVPTDASMRLIVDYLGPSPAFPTYRFSDVLAGRVPESTFRDRIVLIGSNALGTRDTFETPFTAVMPGVERLATVVDSIVHGRHVNRPVQATTIESASMLGVAVLLGVGVSRLPLGYASLLALAIVAAFGISAQLALARFGIWQAAAVPVMAVVVTFIGLSIFRYALLDKERRHVRRMFQRYLAPSMVERLVASASLPRLGGELRELTILFCDLRGFTALSERLDPATLTRVVNGFLQTATDAILAHGGTVDKYVGDAVMAFWNAPVEQPQHAVLACRAALQIRARLRDMNPLTTTAADGEVVPRLDAGIGINTGICTVGNFGSDHRFDYSAIGDPVNIAARLESETRAHDMAILLGPTTAGCIIGSGLESVSLGLLRLRGRAEMLEVHALKEAEAPPSQGRS